MVGKLDECQGSMTKGDMARLKLSANYYGPRSTTVSEVSIKTANDVFEGEVGAGKIGRYEICLLRDYKLQELQKKKKAKGDRNANPT